jgi:hypothetical protein
MTHEKPVRLKDLTPEEQRLVRALIAAANDSADRARAERKAQGLPPTVTDPETIRRVAAICRSVGRG